MDLFVPILVGHRKHEIQILPTSGDSRVHDKDLIDSGVFILKVMVFIENGSVPTAIEMVV